jgi:hypothetical protein
LASHSDTVFASGFHAAGIDWRDIGGSFYNSLGHGARGAAMKPAAACEAGMAAQAGRSRTPIFAAFAALNYPGILLVWPPSGQISHVHPASRKQGIKHGISQNA